jgi:uncharacterized protein YnzC (UPF0291/DUF896 family)
MKTLSGIFTFKLGILVAITVLAVATYRAFAQTPAAAPEPKAKLVLKIKERTTLRRTPADFESVLKNLKTQLYDIDMVDERGQHQKIVPQHAKLDIKTDKVTTSELAKGAEAGELTLIQTRVTQQVSSMYVSDIKAVVDELQ